MKIHPERGDDAQAFTPETATSAERLIEARRLARYRVVAQAASGRSVLDAGGSTSGAQLLAAAGARDVTEFDDDATDRLLYADASFDLIIWLDRPDRGDDQSVLVDEMARVLRPEGVLFIGLPHSGDLRERLATRFANVQSVPESSAALALAGPAGSTPEEGVADVMRLGVDEAGAPDDHDASFAIAGNGSLPHLHPAGIMTATDGLAEAARLLVDAEQRLAEIPALKLQIADLERETAEAHRTAERLSKELAELDGRLMQNERTLVSVMSSPSWKLTKPLRAGKRLLRG